MCRNGEGTCFRICTRTQTKDVADIVCMYVCEAEFGEPLLQPVCAQTFAKRWRCDTGDFHLGVDQLSLV
jgi:hypothetical protein